MGSCKFSYKVTLKKQNYNVFIHLAATPIILLIESLMVSGWFL